MGVLSIFCLLQRHLGTGSSPLIDWSSLRPGALLVVCVKGTGKKVHAYGKRGFVGPLGAGPPLFTAHFGQRDGAVVWGTEDCD